MSKAMQRLFDRMYQALAYTGIPLYNPILYARIILRCAAWHSAMVELLDSQHIAYVQYTRTRTLSVIGVHIPDTVLAKRSLRFTIGHKGYAFLDLRFSIKSAVNRLYARRYTLFRRELTIGRQNREIQAHNRAVKYNRVFMVKSGTESESRSNSVLKREFSPCNRVTYTVSVICKSVKTYADKSAHIHSALTNEYAMRKLWIAPLLAGETIEVFAPVPYSTQTELNRLYGYNVSIGRKPKYVANLTPEHKAQRQAIITLRKQAELSRGTPVYKVYPGIPKNRAIGEDDYLYTGGLSFPVYQNSSEVRDTYPTIWLSFPTPVDMPCLYQYAPVPEPCSMESGVMYFNGHESALTRWNERIDLTESGIDAFGAWRVLPAWAGRQYRIGYLMAWFAGLLNRTHTARIAESKQQAIAGQELKTKRLSSAQRLALYMESRG